MLTSAELQALHSSPGISNRPLTLNMYKQNCSFLFTNTCFPDPSYLQYTIVVVKSQNLKCHFSFLLIPYVYLISMSSKNVFYNYILFRCYCYHLVQANHTKFLPMALKGLIGSSFLMILTSSPHHTTRTHLHSAPLATFLFFSRAVSVALCCHRAAMLFPLSANFFLGIFTSAIQYISFQFSEQMSIPRKNLL